MPVIVLPEIREHWTTFYREIIIFFSALFFTCVVGIIELLPELEKINGVWGLTSISILYFGLLFGVDYSLNKCFWLYAINKEIGRPFNFYFPDLEYLVNKVFKSPHNLKNFLIVIITLIFTIIYLVKIEFLH